jgi:hypothetical protein
MPSVKMNDRIIKNLELVTNSLSIYFLIITETMKNHTNNDNASLI